MNDTLRRAIFAARLTEEDLATHLEVDPKTVRRWLGGRSPYARHRQALANLLAVEESFLWPSLESSRHLDPEVVAIYPHGLEPQAWLTFFDAATNRVDIVHKPDPHPNMPNLARLLERIASKVRVRVIVADSAIGKLIPRPEQDIRWTAKDLAHDIYRVDAELIVRQHAFGETHPHGPLIHLVDLANHDGLFATYTASFEAAWRSCDN